MKKYGALLFLTCLSVFSVFPYYSLYAPWRNEYLQNVAPTLSKETDEASCVFCAQFRESDAKHFILRRFEYNLIMLNRYPYSAGHVMIMPIKHYAQLDEFPPEARIELMELMTAAVKVLKKALGTDAINVGFNLGSLSGASVPGHLHVQVVPRWANDSGGFLGTIAQTRLVTIDLQKVYDELKPYFDTITF